MRRLFAHVMLACAGVVAALVLVEIALRLAWPGGIGFQVQWGMPDDAVESRAHNDFRDATGTYTYDDDGFRAGSGLPYERSILFIGDSFTEGRGVSDDETFARAAERALRRDGVMARSLNAGHRGFGPAQELKVMKRMLGRFRINAVVVQSFPMNDLSDNIAHGGFGVLHGALVEFDPPRAPLRARVVGAIAGSFVEKLYVVRVVANAINSGNAVPYDSTDAFELESALLTEIIATVRARRIPIVVLLVPTQLVQDVRRGLESDGSPAHRGEVQRFESVRRFVMGLDVPWIDAGDLIPDLAADAARVDGAHFSKEGNAAVGEAIARELEPLLRSSPLRPR
jgi:lysophospholipase L1-like esterase